MKTTKNNLPAVEAAIRETHFQGFTDAEVAVAVATAKDLGLSIPNREIYFFKRGGAVLNIVSVHALTKLAIQSGQLDGIEVDQPRPTTKFIWVNGQTREVHDLACTARVYRKDCTRPFSATVFASEYASNGGSWAKMQTTMLQKVAKCHALRMAFSFGAVYDSSEIAEVEETEAPTFVTPTSTAAPIPAPAEVAQTAEMLPATATAAASQAVEIPQELHTALQELQLTYELKVSKSGDEKFIVINAGIKTRKHETELKQLDFAYSPERKLWWRAA